MVTDMVAFFNAMRNDSNHDGKINKNEPNAYPALQACMHHIVYKFTYHIALLLLVCFG
jgi:hypothetical protein